MANKETTAVLDRKPKTAKQDQESKRQANNTALHEAFEAKDWKDVQSFLRANPQIAPLLLKARPQIRRIFGADVVVRLNLVPEYEDNDSLLLFADIQTQADALDAFQKMNLFESEWWLDAAVRAEGMLHFSVEFA